MKATATRPPPGAGELIHYKLSHCALGSLLLASTSAGICALSFGESPANLLAALQARFSHATLVLDAGHSEMWLAQVVAHIADPTVALDLPLDVRGTSFQQRVWQALCEIPAGTTRSYSQIAEKIGSPKSVRAVAGACAANPLALFIPCHRVIRADGRLSGYRWGTERKKILLSREANS
jgi:AraC family transcriptional regulator, regulatory protein of adaptative response / methylated-DNA-[protein]-cysteine methyltransferase